MYIYQDYVIMLINSFLLLLMFVSPELLVSGSGDHFTEEILAKAKCASLSKFNNMGLTTHPYSLHLSCKITVIASTVVLLTTEFY